MFIAKTGESSSPDPKCRLTCVPLILIRPASLGPHRLLHRISYLIILLTTLSVNTNRLQYLTTFTSSPSSTLRPFGRGCMDYKPIPPL
ncbi:hypothetical protein BDV40DRAFT_269892 [Aspergillus tamarii]|uniref:Uncharacterized protein n=1 Tax=Aspergillus tamarii TaxID=41984 RepID=A0A5N6UPP6_ASPTM|nr:hypothetical protein BDV40DRAFT_269892 [Aspergillus tamarii]